MEGYGNENPGAFQPTRPLRGATFPIVNTAIGLFHFNPRAPCGARRDDVPSSDLLDGISTHAPLAGRDTPIGRAATGVVRFQPTRPLRGATKRRSAIIKRGRHFNPRAPCGARPETSSVKISTTIDFNPRAPCGARPPLDSWSQLNTENFNPRAPCGARPPLDSWSQLNTENFNPRAPCGARLLYELINTEANEISTHAPLAGRDPKEPSIIAEDKGFQPTRPLRGATKSHF